MKTEQILNGIKEALIDGKSMVKVSEKAQAVNEASALTGSGLNVGGRIYFDDAFAALRYANPFRQGSRQIIGSGSAAQFVAKTGNATSATNPFGYTVDPNSGSPNISTAFWQLPMRVISAQLPIRSAVLSDINNLEEAVVGDLMLEFSAVEAASMALNNDQSGSTTNTLGGTSGLRGLINYATSTTAAAYGSSGTAITNGLHTILKQTFTAAAITYDNIVDTVSLLPAQYWSLPDVAWHMHPSLIAQLRKLKGSTGGAPMFVEVGDDDGGAVAYVFGFPVIPNPYLAAPAAGAISGVLASWGQFLTIVDGEDMTIQRFDQTLPGTVTLYAEKRMASSVRDPFAGVLLIGA
ncbi:Phage major capsid protein, HK97 [uncultured Caudovirales phage]|uniref:Phage major capsid protein, HK97 n=1 Tax=uncultured Caudovirales phage TaxID=2100421 RepID=A0A6J5KLH8_9CAUD|nr:Phage major capsid protein, HK97 [uncultured Caudovirales phage]